MAGAVVNSCLLAAGALVLNRLIGDPKFMPHPVMLLGRFITMLERHLHPDSVAFPARNRTAARSLRRHGITAPTGTDSAIGKRLPGIVLAVSTVMLAGGATWGMIALATAVSPILGALLSLWLISTTIAWKGLVEAGSNVYRCLLDKGLPDARVAVGMIVGRDTAQLSESEVIRAAVETLAENIVDAIVSPLFFACLGGAPLAMVYRAVNTLDSMVGYRNQKYIDFGWASARLDDVCNFVPARLTACFLAIAVWQSRLPVKRAWRVMRRDAAKHPSPNSGIPEAMVAGALGIALGGTNHYGGVPSVRSVMGERLREREPEDIARTARLVNWTATTAGFVTAAAGAAMAMLAGPSGPGVTHCLFSLLP
ncbi:cobalamin biosynthesis protein CobD [Alicyclobacillus cycloheptanicus]|uniref:Cobalamin biosynthesis protein CobD n=1 Tax=Alicyclobacillus cycloheptanicus TaxID=1457 RepID=A0ABT9XFM3_9BACL|nr:adenosylcobinamide-phosphate synthase CbiB [Alicyclobacillus cycloheptanicus]MDQ0189097.1 adenosylcobinamide-phosphate synthase [Alicyclobacillus cycloheptanicus]WDM00230.1 cobalamin biosynthesis protein CobD [Alicyclobacillus cycloheptanicus]